MCDELLSVGLAAVCPADYQSFIASFRILRVLRVFRMRNIMRRHLQGAVNEAAAKLAMSMLSILFIAAGMFFELEKYAVSAVAT
jgi:hypothetical protein